jgi:hypothetical protein
MIPGRPTEGRENRAPVGRPNSFTVQMSIIARMLCHPPCLRHGQFSDCGRYRRVLEPTMEPSPAGRPCCGRGRMMLKPQKNAGTPATKCNPLRCMQFRYQLQPSSRDKIPGPNPLRRHGLRRRPSRRAPFPGAPSDKMRSPQVVVQSGFGSSDGNYVTPDKGYDKIREPRFPAENAVAASDGTAHLWKEVRFAQECSSRTSNAPSPWIPRRSQSNIEQFRRGRPHPDPLPEGEGGGGPYRWSFVHHSW